MGRGPTAYFLFTSESRESVKRDLETKTGSKVSVAEVSKAIGERWRNLSEEEKLRYKKLAEERAAELRSKEGAEQDDGANEGQDGGTSHKKRQLSASMLPLSLVKKLACRDEDVGRISGDALRVITEATGMFLGQLAGRAYLYASQEKKRKNFKLSDIDVVAKRDQRMIDMGLPDSFAQDETFATLLSQGGSKSKQITSIGIEGEKNATSAAAAGSKNIATFFSVANKDAAE